MVSTKKFPAWSAEKPPPPIMSCSSSLTRKVISTGFVESPECVGKYCNNSADEIAEASSAGSIPLRWDSPPLAHLLHFPVRFGSSNTINYRLTTIALPLNLQGSDPLGNVCITLAVLDQPDPGHSEGELPLQLWSFQAAIVTSRFGTAMSLKGCVAGYVVGNEERSHEYNVALMVESLRSLSRRC